VATPGTAKLDAYGLLSVAGDDARAFLHAQLTNDIEHLPADRARLAGWCSAKGRLLASFLVIPAGGAFLLQLSRDLVAPVQKRLSMFVLRSKVKITDASGEWRQFGVWEPCGGPLAVSADGGRIRVGVDDGRHLLLCRDAAPDADRPESAWLAAEIAAGRVLITQATQEQFVPQMVDFERAGGVDFHKGCYPGQEVVARAQYRGEVKRRLVRLRGAGLRTAQDLFADDAPGQPAGTVVNVAGDEALAVVQVSTLEAGGALRPQAGAPALERLPLPRAA